MCSAGGGSHTCWNHPPSFNNGIVLCAPCPSLRCAGEGSRAACEEASLHLCLMWEGWHRLNPLLRGPPSRPHTTLTSAPGRRSSLHLSSGWLFLATPGCQPGPCSPNLCPSGLPVPLCYRSSSGSSVHSRACSPLLLGLWPPPAASACLPGQAGVLGGEPSPSGTQPQGGTGEAGRRGRRQLRGGFPLGPSPAMGTSSAGLVGAEP